MSETLVVLTRVPPLHTQAALGMFLTPTRAVGSSNGGARCPPKRCIPPAVAVAQVCPRGVVCRGPRPRAVGLNALTVSPVRPCGRMPRPAGTVHGRSAEPLGHQQAL